jgi:hypothetical protein
MAFLGYNIQLFWDTKASKCTAPSFSTGVRLWGGTAQTDSTSIPCYMHVVLQSDACVVRVCTMQLIGLWWQCVACTATIADCNVILVCNSSCSLVAKGLVSLVPACIFLSTFRHQQLQSRSVRQHILCVLGVLLRMCRCGSSTAPASCYAAL